VRVFRGNGSVSTLPRGELKAIFEALAEDMQCVHGVIALMEGEDATPAS
jgi:hypothetical protein